MPSDTRIRLPQEIELKLALPVSAPSSLEKRLSRCPVLARRKPVTVQLHNVYYDTPAQLLRQKMVALRIRRVGDPARPQWLQTLKIGGDSHSALSRRAEWEHSVPSAALLRHALDDTPWHRLDPDGSVFEALAPCFVTAFTRTLWVVRRRDGSVVEVALDVGHIAGADKTVPICELELELLAGAPAALFEVARLIAATVPVLPLSTSKSQRGYRLADGTLIAPVLAQPQALQSGIALPAAARQTLREMFGQFTANLVLLRDGDDPELVHQARVGWRRFKSARRLFRKSLPVQQMPSLEPLLPLLKFLGAQRDLDVAREDVLPQLADAYIGADPQREAAWRGMTQKLELAAVRARKAVRDALDVPTCGAILLAITDWLEALEPAQEPGNTVVNVPVIRRKWAKRQMTRLHEDLETSHASGMVADNQHRTRILAKRLRYAIEALQSLLPRRQSSRWYRQAARLQKNIGNTRDLAQASRLLEKLGADPGLQEFLRGFATGSAPPKPE